MNYIEACEILEVSPEETLPAIKEAYRRKIKFYHPDNYQENKEKLEYADRVTKKINAAWEYIQHNYEREHGKKTKPQVYEPSDNQGGNPVYTYQYPLYQPVFTKKVLIVMAIILGIIVSYALGHVATSVIEMWELQQRYTDEELEWMNDYEFVSTLDGYELSPIHAGFEGKITIPEIFDDEPIVAIGGEAFKGCVSITEVVIPNSVTTIGDSAFEDCTGMTSIVLSDGITEIGHSAFEGCTELTSIEIPEGVTALGTAAFANCTSISSIRIPDSVTEFTEKWFTLGVFEGCSNLSSVYLGAGVTDIYTSMFDNCNQLKDIYLSSNIQEIHSYAFANAYNISNIYYEGTKEQWEEVLIGRYAFETGVTVEIHCANGTIVYTHN